MSIPGLDATALVARRAIHDGEGAVVAYELRSLAVGATAEAVAAAEVALTDLLTGSDLAALGTGQPLLVALPRPFLVGQRQLPDDTGPLVVAAEAGTLADPQVAEGVDRLRQAGHRVALDRWSGDAADEAVLAAVDLVTVSLGPDGLDVDQLPRVVEHARALHPAISVLVTGAPAADAADAAWSAGATGVSGPACRRPAAGHGELAPSEAVCLQVIGALAEDAPTARVEQLVSSDPSLPVRVLAMASSAAAAGRSISSLRQALVLLGPKRLSEWVLLALLSGTRRLSTDHVVPMLARARACGEIATGEADVAYTAGLLSAIAEVVGAEPSATLRAAHASEDITRAVVDGAGPAGASLRAVTAYEGWDAEGVLAQRHDPLDVSRAYLAAVRSAYATAASVGP